MPQFTLRPPWNGTTVSERRSPSPHSIETYGEPQKMPDWIVFQTHSSDRRCPGRKTESLSRYARRISSIGMYETDRHNRLHSLAHGEPGIRDRGLRAFRRPVSDASASICVRFGARHGSGGNADTGLLLERLSESSRVSRGLQHADVADQDCN